MLEFSTILDQIMNQNYFKYHNDYAINFSVR